MNKKYIQGEIMPFCLLCCKSEAILSKTFCPGNQDGVLIWKNFQPGCRDLGWKTEMNVRNFCEGLSRVLRSRKPGQPGQPGSYEEALNAFIISQLRLKLSP